MPVAVCMPCGPSSLTTCVPSTYKRLPSSLVIWKVYAPPEVTSNSPVHTAPELVVSSPAMPGSKPLPSLGKSTVESTRVATGVRSEKSGT